MAVFREKLSLRVRHSSYCGTVLAGMRFTGTCWVDLLPIHHVG